MPRKPSVAVNKTIVRTDVFDWVRFQAQKIRAALLGAAVYLLYSLTLKKHSALLTDGQKGTLLDLPEKAVLALHRTARRRRTRRTRGEEWRALVGAHARHRKKAAAGAEVGSFYKKLAFRLACWWSLFAGGDRDTDWLSGLGANEATTAATFHWLYM